MAIAAKDVMELRRKTGLGMMDCKKALAETEGDVEKASDLLRQRGLAKMDTRSDRASSEGLVIAALSPDKTKGALVEINSETDFTAGNDSFRAMAAKVVEAALQQDPGQVTKTDAMQAAIDDVRLTTKENVQFGRGMVLGGGGSRVGSYVHFNAKVGALVQVQLPPQGAPDGVDEFLKELCQHIVASSPAPIAVTEDQVPSEILEKERQIAKAQAIESGKPEQIAEQMVTGKIRKFYEGHVLLKQPYIRDDKKSVSEILPKGLKIEAFARFQIG